MRNIFKADVVLNSIWELTPEKLREIGVSALIADLDNTLARRDVKVPCEKAVEWLEALKRADIKVAVVSNNSEKRVQKYCAPLNIPFFWRGKKPGRKYILAAIESLGGDAAVTALVGDRVLTDVLGAKRSGIKAIKVKRGRKAKL